MAYSLIPARNGQAEGFVSRFDPRFWTVNFPRPMMAAVTTPAPDALRVDLAFYGQDDLAGLIWEAEDRWDHPLLAYETARDFRQCRLSLHWRSSGVRGLDAVNGPVLTIEGRDAGGNPRAWYVRLFNRFTSAIPQHRPRHQPRSLHHAPEASVRVDHPARAGDAEMQLPRPGGEQQHVARLRRGHPREPRVEQRHYPLGHPAAQRIAVRRIAHLQRPGDQPHAVEPIGRVPPAQPKP